jgi:hypothetical protein
MKSLLLQRIIFDTLLRLVALDSFVLDAFVKNTTDGKRVVMTNTLGNLPQ